MSADDILLPDGSCPHCGSLNVAVMTDGGLPMKCQDCGWRGYGDDDEE